MKTTQCQRFQLLLGISLLLLLSAACKKSGSGSTETTATPAANSPAAMQPAPAANSPAATQPLPAAPATPLPTFSAAKKIGMFAYPKNNQSSDQQLRDEYDCYTLVQQQTGINPETPPPSGPSSAQVQNAEQQAAANAPQAKEDARKGLRRGLREERRSEQSPAMQAEVRPLERLSVPFAVAESSARRTSNPRNRRRSRQVHKRNSKPINPRPPTTNKWIPSSEDSRLVWMRADIQSSRTRPKLTSRSTIRSIVGLSG